MGHLIVIIITISLNKIFMFNKKINFFWFIPAIFLGLSVGLQNNVGTDYFSYINLFNRLKILKLTESFFIEPGFHIMIKILHFIDLGPQSLFVLSSLISYIFIFLFIKDEINKGSWIFIFLFFSIGGVYYQSYNLIRQTMAISIFLYSIRFIKRKQFIYYMLTIIICSFFHKSILIFIPIYFLYGIKMSLHYKFIYSVLLMSSIFTNFYDRLIFLIIDQFDFLGYSHYIGHQSNTFKNVDLEIGVLFYITLIIISLVLINQKNISKKRSFYMNLAYLYFIIHFITLNYTTFHRISLYLNIFYIFIIIELYLCLQKKFNKNISGIYIFMILTYYTLVNIKILLINPENEYIYSNILFRFFN